MFGKKGKRPLRIKKSREILHEAFNWFQKKKKKLSPQERDAFEAKLRALDSAVLDKNREEASRLAKEVERYHASRRKKGVFHYVFEVAVALAIALVIATVVRQMWFEIYEIPTGSMRPTFKEQDHVTVSKTAFGINTPLKTEHLYFDPDLVQRTGVVIFSGDKLPLRDVDASYFGILPYTKRFIKRLIGKPGDTLYFYGGKVYGIDKDGNEIREFLDAPHMKNLEYVPFLTFEGDVYETPNAVLFHQMHQAIGRLVLGSFQQAIGQVRNNKTWVVDNPTAQKAPHKQIETYSDFWGFRNYAMARLLTREEVDRYTDMNTRDLEPGLLYLELRHTPSLTYPTPHFGLRRRGSNWFIPGYKTVIPLQQEHLEKIMRHMYTARFVVQDGKAKRYQVNNHNFSALNPAFPEMPNGTYEFYHGILYKIGFGGTATPVKDDARFLRSDPAWVQKLFNQGINFNIAYSPADKAQTLYPHRYAYFRDGALYLLGGEVLPKEDKRLKTFHIREAKRQQAAPRNAPYVAFQDYGPPYKDGKIDKAFLDAFGLKVPPKHYLVLGDNHAMSSDSRVFGFLPEENIQGIPRMIVWPFGKRWGPPNQVAYPLFTVPRVIIWIIAALVIGGFFGYQKWRNSRSLFPKD